MHTKKEGEHLSLTSEDYIKPGCGCDIANGVIKYCPKHSACDDMYEASKGIVADLENVIHPDVLEATLAALAKAGGK